MMKIINNFELLSSKMNFNSDDEFYFLQITTRPKDGHSVGGSNKNRMIKYYIIKSIEQFLNLEKEIIELCNLFNARAYIHPTKRSYKAVARLYTRTVVDTFCSGNYRLTGKEFSTSCGQSYITSDKQYIIDLDDCLDENDCISQEYLKDIIDILNNCEPFVDKILYSVPTISGFHLICKPFNTRKFNQDCMIKFGKSVDVHKNNPTLLYFKSNKVCKQFNLKNDYFKCTKIN